MTTFSQSSPPRARKSVKTSIQMLMTPVLSVDGNLRARKERRALTCLLTISTSSPSLLTLTPVFLLLACSNFFCGPISSPHTSLVLSPCLDWHICCYVVCCVLSPVFFQPLHFVIASLLPSVHSLCRRIYNFQCLYIKSTTTRRGKEEGKK